jgi:hypothetical protein
LVSDRSPAGGIDPALRRDPLEVKQLIILTYPAAKRIPIGLSRQADPSACINEKAAAEV